MGPIATYLYFNICFAAKRGRAKSIPPAVPEQNVLGICVTGGFCRPNIFPVTRQTVSKG